MRHFTGRDSTSLTTHGNLPAEIQQVLTTRLRFSQPPGWEWAGRDEAAGLPTRSLKGLSSSSLTWQAGESASGDEPSELPTRSLKSLSIDMPSRGIYQPKRILRPANTLIQESIQWLPRSLPVISDSPDQNTEGAIWYTIRLMFTQLPGLKTSQSWQNHRSTNMSSQRDYLVTTAFTTNHLRLPRIISDFPELSHISPDCTRLVLQLSQISPDCTWLILQLTQTSISIATQVLRPFEKCRIKGPCTLGVPSWLPYINPPDFRSVSHRLEPHTERLHRLCCFRNKTQVLVADYKFLAFPSILLI